MDKITKKLIKYFMSIMTLVIAVCFAASSIFLSRFYINQQYNSLKSTANYIYDSLSKGQSMADINESAILITNDGIVTLGHTKMGVMPFLRNLNPDSLSQKGRFNSPMNEEFLYYRLSTGLGDIIVLQSNKFSANYMNIVYLTLLFIFLIALTLSVPLISYVGRKFTSPILKIQKASRSIAKGNFDIDLSINTRDEIEALANSISDMALSLKRKYDLQRDFIANVSHDFKTPLSIIRSSSEAIFDNLVEGETRKTYAGDIIGEVDRLNGMVTDLMELSKLQSGNYELTKEYFSITALLNECSCKFKSIASSKNIEITVCSLPVNIHGDSRYLSRVIYNFIENAIKFSPQYGQIKVSAEENSSGGIRVSVTDQGPGISEHMLEDIWNRYYKHSESGGMGLGLAICSEILKMHGFYYNASSIPNTETKFYFIIPDTDISDSASINK